MDHGAIATVLLAAAGGVVATTKWAFGITAKVDVLQQQVEANEQAAITYQQNIGQTITRVETKVDRLVDHLLDKS
jgi:hypothetical protein